MCESNDDLDDSKKEIVLSRYKECVQHRKANLKLSLLRKISHFIF